MAVPVSLFFYFNFFVLFFFSLCWNDAETDDQHKEPAMIDTKIIKMGNELVPYRQLLKL